MNNVVMTFDPRFMFVNDYEIGGSSITYPTSGSGVIFSEGIGLQPRHIQAEPKLISLDCEKCGGEIEMHNNIGFCLHCGHRVMLLK